MNIVDPILFQCALQRKAAASCAPDTGISLISYGWLANMIHNICRHMMKLGVGNEDVYAAVVANDLADDWKLRADAFFHHRRTPMQWPRKS